MTFSSLLGTLPRKIGALCLLAVIAWAAWQCLKPDPREAFLKDVDSMLQLANEGKHTELTEWLSPEARERIKSEWMPPGVLLRELSRVDMQEGRRYRLVNLDVFYPGDYAEVTLERSDIDGAFKGSTLFPVPFIRFRGDWKVASGFRSDRDWIYPN